MFNAMKCKEYKLFPNNDSTILKVVYADTIIDTIKAQAQYSTILTATCHQKNKIPEYLPTYPKLFGTVT